MLTLKLSNLGVLDLQHLCRSKDNSNWNEIGVACCECVQCPLLTVQTWESWAKQFESSLNVSSRYTSRHVFVALLNRPFFRLTTVNKDLINERIDVWVYDRQGLEKAETAFGVQRDAFSTKARDKSEAEPKLFII